MVVPIPPSFQFKKLLTTKQFLLLSNPPELEEKFQAHKAVHGSKVCKRLRCVMNETDVCVDGIPKG